MQIQALRPNGKGRFIILNGHHYHFQGGVIRNESGNEAGYYDKNGNGELNGQSFRLQRDWVMTLN